MSLARYLSKLGALLTSDGKVQQAALAANVAGNGPAFSAYTGGGQSITANTYTKVAINTEVFDINSNYDTSLYRFKPTVAGYYQLNITVGVASSSTSYYADVSLYRNGSQYNGLPFFGGGGNGTAYYRGASSIVVYADGVNDYFEVYMYISSTQSTSSCYFSGSLVRAA